MWLLANLSYLSWLHYISTYLLDKTTIVNLAQLCLMLGKDNTLNELLSSPSLSSSPMKCGVIIVNRHFTVSPMKWRVIIVNRHFTVSLWELNQFQWDTGVQSMSGTNSKPSVKVVLESSFIDWPYSPLFLVFRKLLFACSFFLTLSSGLHLKKLPKRRKSTMKINQRCQKLPQPTWRKARSRSWAHFPRSKPPAPALPWRPTM